MQTSANNRRPVPFQKCVLMSNGELRDFRPVGRLRRPNITFPGRQQFRRDLFFVAHLWTTRQPAYLRLCVLWGLCLDVYEIRSTKKTGELSDHGDGANLEDWILPRQRDCL